MKINGRKRALSALLALALALSLLPGAALAENGTLTGSGTAQDPYLIADAADLKAFRDKVNGEDSAPYHAKLTADIALNGEWTPFGSLSSYPTTAYAGTFDGGGHTVRGWKVEDSGSNGVGFFGTVNGATIRALHLEGTVSATSSAFVGGLVGKTQGAVTIQNCSFSGAVSSDKTGSNAGVGGIVGRVNAGSVTLSDCANAATVTGGAAGGILGYCTAKGTTVTGCSNTGTVTGSARTGGIAGQVTSTTAITGCTSTLAPISGFGGVLTDCTIGQAVKDPRLVVSGSADLYDGNAGPKPAATLTARFVDLDPSPVTWTLASGGGVVELVTPESVDANNTTVSVQALKPGKATVKATVETDAVESGQLSAEVEITVWPFITTAEVATPMTVTMEDGSQVNLELTGAAAGQTARARIHVLGGEELDYDIFPVTVQWKYLSAQDYSSGNTASSSYQNIPGATGLTYTVPQEREGDYLSFTFRFNGEDKIPNRPYEVRAAAKAAQEAANLAQREQTKKQLQEVLDGCAALHPVWGRDENVERMLEGYLADHGFEGYTATVKAVEEVYGGGGVADNGDITYFYADPNTTPALHSASYKVTLDLEKDGQTQAKELTVVIPWDQDKVKAVLREEIGQKLALDTDQAVTEDLSLPKVIDGKKWALISWASSSDAIAISGKNQTTADTLFDPYVGVVKQGKTDQAVTLTATVHFQLTEDAAPITLVYTYPLTVKALEPTQQERIEAQLRAKLEAGLAKAGLTDTVTGQRLRADENGVYTVSHDVQLPTTRDFGVDGKYYPVTVTTDTEALVAPDVNNAARVEVYRPGVGQADAAGAITITLHDKDTTAAASLVLPVTVPALTQSEIDQELALMDRVKTAYFEGLRGENTARDNVRTDLTPFLEVYEENGALVWVRSNAERTGRGIAPIPMEGWEELELWRLFKSSNPNVISHENLLVTRQAEAKAVSVTSHLSSQSLGRYGQLYREDPARYAQYAALAPLYDQPVSTDLSTSSASLLSSAMMSMARQATATMVVRGTRDPESAVPVVQTIDDVTISLSGLDGQVWVEPQTRWGLSESDSVYDLFLEMLGEDYVATRVKGTYIQAISGPQGTLAEKEYGENSGWMYRVNGQLPEVYMGAHPLHSGDVVQVFYTRDASQESPIWTKPSASPKPSAEPTAKPSAQPSSSPSAQPSVEPSTKPSASPSAEPSTEPSVQPSAKPSVQPSASPSTEPSVKPSAEPSASPAPKPATRPSSGSSTATKPEAAPASQAPVPAASARFTDVAADAWYADALTRVCDAGLMQGVSEERFAPELELSRGMLVCVLYRMADPNAQPGSNLFADIAPDAWYAKEAAWALQAGVVTGYSDTAFGGEDPITREQLVVMLYRYAKLSGRNTAGRDSLTEFADSGSISPWAREAMAWAIDSGLLRGLPDGSLAPAATATRAQVAVMLARYLDKAR